MSVARSVTQSLFKSGVLSASAVAGGWLRLDRLFEVTWLWARRSTVRRLTPFEIHEAQRVFGNSIPYEDVRVAERSPLARRIAAVSGRVHLPQGERLAVTVFHTIHFSTRLRPGYDSMPWLIHELTHVWQYCQIGPRYLTDALKAQSEHGHEAYSIEKGLADGWAWEQFNLEQQGDVASEYYRRLISDDDPDLSLFEPHVKALRRAVIRRRPYSRR